MTWKDIPRNPTTKTLRQFGLLCLLFFGIAGGWRLAHGATVWGGVFLALAGVGGVLGLVRPRALRWVFVGWMIAVFPIGWVVSHVLLGVIFFALFTPIAIVFRLIGRDPLRLRTTDAETHWLPKPPPPGPESYYHQY